MATKRTTSKSSWTVEQISLGLMAGALVLFVLVYGWSAMVGPEVLEADDEEEVSEYAFVNQDVPQAVFLTNGQVYFGTMTAMTEDVFVLEQVHYLQTQEATEGENGEGATDVGFSLVELGASEVHAPESSIVVERDQVLYWENLTADSAVTQAMQ